jgi:hypothetical protein
VNHGINPPKLGHNAIHRTFNSISIRNVHRQNQPRSTSFARCFQLIRGSSQEPKPISATGQLNANRPANSPPGSGDQCDWCFHCESILSDGKNMRNDFGAQATPASGPSLPSAASRLMIVLWTTPRCGG